MRLHFILLLALIGCSAPRPSVAVQPLPPTPVTPDASSAPDVAITDASVTDATPPEARPSVTLTLPDGGTVTLTREHTEHTVTAVLAAAARGVSDTRFHMEDGADPFHPRPSADGARAPDVELILPEARSEFGVALSGPVAMLQVRAAGAAAPGLLVDRSVAGDEVHTVVGGSGRVSTASFEAPGARDTFTVTPCSPRSGRGTVTLRFSLGVGGAIADPGASEVPARTVFASFVVRDAGECAEGRCERWSVRLRGAVTRTIPAGRAVPSLELHSTRATLSPRPSFEASTSGTGDDVYAWRVRSLGGTYVIEHSAAGAPWRRVGGFALPARVSMVPDPDGVVQ